MIKLSDIQLCFFDDKVNEDGFFQCLQCGRPFKLKADKPPRRTCSASVQKDELVTFTDFMKMAWDAFKNKQSKQIPSLFQRFKRYKKEHKQWVQNGKHYRSSEYIQYLYNKFCKDCEHNIQDEEDNICDICGCFIGHQNMTMNKLAWITTSCPDDPPQWTPQTSYPGRYKLLQVDEEELKNRQTTKPRKRGGRKGGCCGGGKKKKT